MIATRGKLIGASRIVEDLNPAQREAVRHGEGPLLVVAGPGSGKTRVIAHRIGLLLSKGVPAWRILALTFTNKAAAEMARRVRELAGEDAEGIWVSTFHSFCARILRIEGKAIGVPEGFVIYDADDSDRVIRDALKREKISLGGVLSKGDLRARISLMKNDLAAGAKGRRGADFASALVRRVHTAYQKRLAEAGALDFDDLLVRAIDLFEKKPKIRAKYAERFLHILVDEYQDTNRAQAKILSLLASKHRNVCVTGDPDQSIYGWRGATIRNILDFPRTFRGTEVVKLERGYRSTKRILEAADRVIAHNRDRIERTLRTENPAGEPVHVIRLATQEAEAEQIAAEIAAMVKAGRRPREFAVLYRINAYSRALEQEFVRRKIPYAIVGGIGFFERKEIKDALAYLRLVVNPLDDLSFERIANVPRRGIGAKAIETLRAAGRPLIQAAADARLREKIRGAGARGLADLSSIYDEIATQSRSPVAPLVERVLDRTGYRKELEAEGEEERLQNLDELAAAAKTFDADEKDGDLRGFLDRVALITDVDRWKDREDRVTMMTLHMAKGLEFPVVFIAGVQEGLIPFVRRTGPWWEEPELDPEKLEEERRLFFVGMTRAKRLLVLTHCEEGSRRGWDDFVEPSPFLEELPREAIREIDASRRSSGGRKVRALVSSGARR